MTVINHNLSKLEKQLSVRNKEDRRTCEVTADLCLITGLTHRYYLRQKNVARRTADQLLACTQRGRAKPMSGVDPLSALHHPDGDIVSVDQPQGHIVGYP